MGIGAASCYIPVEELNQDQLERLDNITYRWCNCERCRRPLKIGDKVLIPQNAGHANRKTLEICLSRQVPKENMDITPPIFLLTLIAISLHEIVHILFPRFDEDQTVNKTWEWLKQNSWVTYAEARAVGNIDGIPGDEVVGACVMDTEGYFLYSMNGNGTSLRNFHAGSSVRSIAVGDLDGVLIMK